jgi:guanylate cyclase
MKDPTFKQLAIKIADLIAEPGDDRETRLQKTLLVGSSFMIILAAVVWGAIYLFFKEPAAAAIPLSYAAISFLSFIIFAITRHYRIYRIGQLALILLLPFFLMLTLGGFIYSSAVILWSLLCPLGALIFSEPKRAPLWMISYIGLIIISGLLQPYISLPNNLPSSVVTIFFVLNFGAVSVTFFILLYYFVHEKNKAYYLLNLEQEKSDKLLLNVLPKEIGPILKRGTDVIADHYKSASVLFADIVGFTPLSNEMAPEEVVKLLNEVFMKFDSLVEKYNLEKIRTIGDNYMVAAGVPTPRSDHAQAIADLGLDMLTYIKNQRSNGNELSFRIGINSGPVIAGVIGSQKFHYDVWGDAVNTASRMESHGVADRIQITSATYELIKNEFVCKPRGVIDVKGKGTMETWFLIKRKDARETQQEDRYPNKDLTSVISRVA